MQITLLGSGAANPTAARNTSGIYASHEGTNILLDCGEGTLRQILSLGLSPDVDAILLTHAHPDHILGLTGLIRQMRLNKRDRPIKICGPEDTVKKVKELLSFDSDDASSPAVSFVALPDTTPVSAPVQEGSLTITPFTTSHRASSLGYRLDGAPPKAKIDLAKARTLGLQPGPLMGQLQRGETVALPSGQIIKPADALLPEKPGPSVCYTGDTVPTPSIPRAVQNTDLLIYDSTYLERDKDLATLRAHATAAQAAIQAKEAAVGALVLTHISSRYSPVELEEFTKEASAIFSGPVFLAHDGLALQISNLSVSQTPSSPSLAAGA